MAASPINIYRLLNLSCVKPSKAIIKTTGKLPKELINEYLVAACFFPMANNIIAVNAAFIKPKLKAYADTPITKNRGCRGKRAIKKANKAQSMPQPK